MGIRGFLRTGGFAYILVDPRDALVFTQHILKALSGMRTWEKPFLQWYSVIAVYGNAAWEPPLTWFWPEGSEISKRASSVTSFAFVGCLLVFWNAGTEKTDEVLSTMSSAAALRSHPFAAFICLSLRNTQGCLKRQYREGRKWWVMGKEYPLKHKQDKHLEQFEQNLEWDFLQGFVVIGCLRFSCKSYLSPSY